MRPGRYYSPACLRTRPGSALVGRLSTRVLSAGCQRASRASSRRTWRVSLWSQHRVQNGGSIARLLHRSQSTKTARHRRCDPPTQQVVSGKYMEQLVWTTCTASCSHVSRAVRYALIKTWSGCKSRLYSSKSGASRCPKSEISRKTHVPAGMHRVYALPLLRLLGLACPSVTTVLRRRRRCSGPTHRHPVLPPPVPRAVQLDLEFRNVLLELDLFPIEHLESFLHGSRLS